MSIDPSGAEKALERLRQSCAEAEDRILQSELASFRLKQEEAIVVEELWQQKVPTTLIPKLIYKDHRVIKSGEAKAQAVANLGGVNMRRDADNKEISIYQSRVKDQL